MLCPYPRGGAPSQRFRYEQYLDALEEAGYEYRILPFIDAATNQILYQPGHTYRKVWSMLRGYGRRVQHVWLARKADAVFVHREAAPLGPPWVEWVVAKILRRLMIYDFDDAIWLKDRSGVNSWVSRLKWHSKVARICRWSAKVSVGNAYLADFVRPFNSQVIINPTTIDTKHHHSLVSHQTQDVAIGWTGSHSTLKYLATIEPVLRRLSKSHAFRFVVIADRPPELDLPNLSFVRWQQRTEIEDLLCIHIGIMPLPDDPWSRGKCGFKALQYMALGIPAVVSPVGVNEAMVIPGVHGFHCRSEDDWYEALQKLLTDADLRRRMGQAGRQRVEQHYSVRTNTPNFLSLLP